MDQAAPRYAASIAIAIAWGDVDRTSRTAPVDARLRAAIDRVETDGAA